MLDRTKWWNHLLSRGSSLVWIKIKKNDCHAIRLATIRNLSRGWTDYGEAVERVRARQSSIRVPFFFLPRTVNVIVKRKSFVKLVDDRDNCASLRESLAESESSLLEKERKRISWMTKPDDPDVRINYANVYERLSGTRSLFRLGNIYIGYTPT